MSEEPRLPNEHPESIRWVCLLHAKSRVFPWRGREFQIRVHTRLKKGDWRYGVPVPKSLARELVKMTTFIEPLPNERGEVRSSVLRTVPLYKMVPPPPFWRSKLRGLADLVQFADGIESEVSEPISGLGSDPEHIAQLVRDETESQVLDHWRRLIEADVVTPEGVRAAVEKGVAPQTVLELIPKGDEEADLIVAMSFRDVVGEIHATTDPSMLARIWAAENRRKLGIRVNVKMAYEEQVLAIKELVAAPAREPNDAGDPALPPAIDP